GTFDDKTKATFSSDPVIVLTSKSAVGRWGDVRSNTGSNARSPENLTKLLQNVFDETMTPVGATGTKGSPLTVDLAKGGKSGTLSSTLPFRFASIHGGQYQWLIDFGVQITSFSFDKLERGFSGAVVTTPIPGAALLFAPALGVLALVRRRRARAAA
ncbi:MAG: hypothetical protein ACOC3D_12255, partial [Pseudomonadota bacterium]